MFVLRFPEKRRRNGNENQRHYHIAFASSTFDLDVHRDREKVLRAGERKKDRPARFREQRRHIIALLLRDRIQCSTCLSVERDTVRVLVSIFF